MWWPYAVFISRNMYSDWWRKHFHQTKCDCHEWNQGNTKHPKKVHFVWTLPSWKMICTLISDLGHKLQHHRPAYKKTNSRDINVLWRIFDTSNNNVNGWYYISNVLFIVVKVIIVSFSFEARMLLVWQRLRRNPMDGLCPSQCRFVSCWRPKLISE